MNSYEESYLTDVGLGFFPIFPKSIFFQKQGVTHEQVKNHSFKKNDLYGL